MRGALAALGLQLMRWRRPAALPQNALARLTLTHTIGIRESGGLASSSATGTRTRTLWNDDLNLTNALHKRCYAAASRGGRKSSDKKKSGKSGKTCKGGDGRRSTGKGRTSTGKRDPDDERMLSDGGGSKGEFSKFKEFVKKTKPRSTIEKVIPCKQQKQIKKAAQVVTQTARKTVDTAKKTVESATQKVKDTVKKVQEPSKPSKKNK